MKLGKVLSMVALTGGLLVASAGLAAAVETPGLALPPGAPASLKPSLAPTDLASARINTNVMKSLTPVKITTLQVAKPVATGKFVPEFDAKSSGAAIALLLGGVAVLVERRRRSANVAG